MAKKIINVKTPSNFINTGSAPNARDGDSLRSSFARLNQAVDNIDANFTELYNSVTKLTTAVPTSSVGIPGSVAGQIAFDNVYLYYCTGTYDGSSHIWKRIAWSVGTW